MTDDIRDSFFDEFLNIARKDKDIIFMCADQGAFSLLKFKDELPDQYYDIGISEQALISTAAGLSLSNKRVFIYAIAPFITSRCYEQIKVDLSVMNLPVTIVGSGPGVCYAADGPTHHACEDISIMSTLPNMNIYTPSDHLIAKFAVNDSYLNISPSYVRLDKGPRDTIYSIDDDLKDGFFEIKRGKDFVIVSSGKQIQVALEISDYFSKKGIVIGVIDLFKINSDVMNCLSTKIQSYDTIITIEDTFINSGIGSLVLNFLANNRIFNKKIYKFGPSNFVKKYGDRDWIEKEIEIDFSSLKNKISKIVNIQSI